MQASYLAYPKPPCSPDRAGDLHAGEVAKEGDWEYGEEAYGHQQGTVHQGGAVGNIASPADDKLHYQVQLGGGGGGGQREGEMRKQRGWLQLQCMQFSYTQLMAVGA